MPSLLGIFKSKVRGGVSDVYCTQSPSRFRVVKILMLHVTCIKPNQSSNTICGTPSAPFLAVAQGLIMVLGYSTYIVFMKFNSKLLAMCSAQKVSDTSPKNPHDARWPDILAARQYTDSSGCR